MGQRGQTRTQLCQTTCVEPPWRRRGKAQETLMAVAAGLQQHDLQARWGDGTGP